MIFDQFSHTCVQPRHLVVLPFERQDLADLIMIIKMMTTMKLAMTTMRMIRMMRKVVKTLTCLPGCQNSRSQLNIQLTLIHPWIAQLNRPHFFDFSPLWIVKWLASKTSWWYLFIFGLVFSPHISNSLTLTNCIFGLSNITSAFWPSVQNSSLSVLDFTWILKHGHFPPVSEVRLLLEDELLYELLLLGLHLGQGSVLGGEPENGF